MDRFLVPISSNACHSSKASTSATRPASHSGAQQRIEDLAKVVKLRTARVCVTVEELQRLKGLLEDAQEEQLLEALRHLSCYSVDAQHLETLQLAAAVKTARRRAGEGSAVAKLAGRLLEKWRGDVIEAHRLQKRKAPFASSSGSSQTTKQARGGLQ